MSKKTVAMKKIEISASPIIFLEQIWAVQNTVRDNLFLELVKPPKKIGGMEKK